MDGSVAVAAVNGTSGLQGDTVVQSTIDPEQLVTYLSNVLQALFGATEHDLKARDSLLNTHRRSDTLQRCSRFAQEAQAAALYIYKIHAPTSAHEDEDDSDGTNGVTGAFLGENRMEKMLMLLQMASQTTPIRYHRTSHIHHIASHASASSRMRRRSTCTVLSQDRCGS